MPIVDLFPWLSSSVACHCNVYARGYGSGRQKAAGGKVVLVCPVVETSNASDPGSLGIKQQTSNSPMHNAGWLERGREGE